MRKRDTCNTSGVKVTHDVDAPCFGTMKPRDVHLYRKVINVQQSQEIMTHLSGWTFDPPQNKIVTVQLLAALRGSMTVQHQRGRRERRQVYRPVVFLRDWYNSKAMLPNLTGGQVSQKGVTTLEGISWQVMWSIGFLRRLEVRQEGRTQMLGCLVRHY